MALFTQAPKSICILRLSAIGDVCHVLAVVQQIQQYWGNTKLTWIIGKTERQLFENIKDIEFIVYDKKTGLKGICKLWKALKNQNFDALLNMQTALRASIISLGIKATYKIGFGKKRAREGQWLITNRKITDPENPHVLAGFMAFAEYLGIPTDKPHWNLGITNEQKQKVMPFIEQYKKNIIISPCSSKAEKDWLIERYADVANIAHKNNINVILCGSSAKREREMIEKIILQCHFEPINLCGQTSLLELTALISLVDLVIAPDSGPAHIATTQGTPVIGLYAYHNPLRTGPFNNLDNIVEVYEKNVQKEFGKPSSQLPWATKLKGKNLMTEIQVKDVISQMKQLNIL